LDDGLLKTGGQSYVVPCVGSALNTTASSVETIDIGRKICTREENTFEEQPDRIVWQETAVTIRRGLQTLSAAWHPV